MLNLFAVNLKTDLGRVHLIFKIGITATNVHIMPYSEEELVTLTSCPIKCPLNRDTPAVKLLFI